MFDIGWSEILVIGVVAIIAIGPKDLPLALKTVGQWVARARALAREFQGSLDEMIREAELDKVKKDMEAAVSSVDVTKDFEATKAEVEKALELPSIEDPLATPPEAKPAEQSSDAPVDKPVEMPTAAIEPTSTELVTAEPVATEPAAPAEAEAKPVDKDKAEPAAGPTTGKEPRRAAGQG